MDNNISNCDKIEILTININGSIDICDNKISTDTMIYYKIIKNELIIYNDNFANKIFNKFNDEDMSNYQIKIARDKNGDIIKTKYNLKGNIVKKTILTNTDNDTRDITSPVSPDCRIRYSFYNLDSKLKLLIINLNGNTKLNYIQSDYLYANCHINILSSNILNLKDIHQDELSISISGYGIVNIQDVSPSKLNIFISGEGKINFRDISTSISTKSNVTIIGNGYIDFNNYHLEMLNINISGSGNIKNFYIQDLLRLNINDKTLIQGRITQRCKVVEEHNKSKLLRENIKLKLVK